MCLRASVHTRSRGLCISVEIREGGGGVGTSFLDYLGPILGSCCQGRIWTDDALGGRWRRVTIDDRMPVDLFGTPLLVGVRPLQLWPLLLSKAVMKIMAAYKCAFFSYAAQLPTERDRHTHTRAEGLDGSRGFGGR